MTAQHAAAPWTANPVDDDNLIRIKNAEGGQVAICSNFSFFDTPETLPSKELVNEANARRIVACVNACEGVSTEVLERGARHDWGDLMTSLEKQRDQLLAALEEARVFIGKQPVRTETVGKNVYLREDQLEVMRVMGNIDAAIAAAKAGAA